MFNGELSIDVQKLPSLLVKRHETNISGVIVFLVMQLLATYLLTTKKVQADDDTTVWVKLATEEDCIKRSIDEVKN
jgi:hypothetical protein